MSMRLQLVFWMVVVGLTANYIRDLWTEACWDAEYAEKLESRREPEGGIIITWDDPNAIRQLAESGKVCEVMGHQWHYDETWVVLRCKLCATIRSFQLKTETRDQ